MKTTHSFRVMHSSRGAVRQTPGQYGPPTDARRGNFVKVGNAFSSKSSELSCRPAVRRRALCLRCLCAPRRLLLQEQFVHSRGGRAVSVPEPHWKGQEPPAERRCPAAERPGSEPLVTVYNRTCCGAFTTSAPAPRLLLF